MKIDMEQVANWMIVFIVCFLCLAIITVFGAICYTIIKSVIG